MRATLMYGAGDVRVEKVPDPKLHRAHRRGRSRSPFGSICGSDLWPYAGKPVVHSRPSGWATSSWASSRTSAREVPASKTGDVVLAPFLWSDGTCDFCREGSADLVPARRLLA